MSAGNTGALTALGAREAAGRIRDGKISPVDLVDACLDRIHALDGRLSAWAYVDDDGARATASALAAEARAWAHTRPTGDAPVVSRLRAAGAVILGKTHTTEFAYRDPAPTRNPWNLGHTPGGSSAGSGAAVAARMVPLALGTQTVGSILRPAAYCGGVGVNATHGLTPTEDVVPLAWSLDH